MVLSGGGSLSLIKAEMILLCEIISRRRESLIMILCLAWYLDHVRALEIVASHEILCLNRVDIMEESDT